jgi:hypothetical protein
LLAEKEEELAALRAAIKLRDRAAHAELQYQQLLQHRGGGGGGGCGGGGGGGDGSVGSSLSSIGAEARLAEGAAWEVSGGATEDNYEWSAPARDAPSPSLASSISSPASPPPSSAVRLRGRGRALRAEEAMSLAGMPRVGGAGAFCATGDGGAGVRGPLTQSLLMGDAAAAAETCAATRRQHSNEVDRALALALSRPPESLAAPPPQRQLSAATQAAAVAAAAALDTTAGAVTFALATGGAAAAEGGGGSEQEQEEAACLAATTRAVVGRNCDARTAAALRPTNAELASGALPARWTASSTENAAKVRAAAALPAARSTALANPWQTLACSLSPTNHNHRRPAPCACHPPPCILPARLPARPPARAFTKRFAQIGMQREVARLSDAELERQLLALGLHAPGGAEAREAAMAPETAGGVPLDAQERQNEALLQQKSLGLPALQPAGEAVAGDGSEDSGLSPSQVDAVNMQITALEQKLMKRLNSSTAVDELLQHTGDSDSSSSSSSSGGGGSSAAEQTSFSANASGAQAALGKTSSTILGLGGSSAFSTWD